MTDRQEPDAAWGAERESPGRGGACPGAGWSKVAWLDLTCATAAENLACDEALLEAAEAGWGGEVLRVWEPREHFVVLGHGNGAAQEAELGACQLAGIPVFRRCSGGGAVLQGPGCLNYSLVLRCDGAGPLASVTTTNRFIMRRHAEVAAGLAAARMAGEGGGARSTLGEVRVQGVTDLALGDRKFSGNAQRRKHRHLLFHGTFLLAFNLVLIAKCLRFPTQQPGYRQGRSHLDFLVNLPVNAEALKAALRKEWRAEAEAGAAPSALIDQLVLEKYSRPEWNMKYS